MNTIDNELISNFNSEQHRLIINILYTADWLNNKVSETVKAKGITHVQYNVMRILLGSYPESLKVGDVKKRLINKKADVTRILDRLCEKKMIKRDLCPENRRQVDVIISKKGIKIMEELSPLIKGKLDNYFDQLVTNSDAKKANKLLDTIRYNRSDISL